MIALLLGLIADAPEDEKSSTEINEEWEAFCKELSE